MAQHGVPSFNSDWEFRDRIFPQRGHVPAELGWLHSQTGSSAAQPRAPCRRAAGPPAMVVPIASDERTPPPPQPFLPTGSRGATRSTDNRIISQSSVPNQLKRLDGHMNKYISDIALCAHPPRVVTLFSNLVHVPIVFLELTIRCAHLVDHGYNRDVITKREEEIGHRLRLISGWRGVEEGQSCIMNSSRIRTRTADSTRHHGVNMSNTLEEYNFRVM